eukprot:gnl/TRDRNA2_/TRDRNA2_128405_c0_seq1.p1 gnl/TRDRNA2_/TRDRNA2_128405_c0~~gnl/TRDRNA2_/TRDRNA2_128405_c0_seq1.p1  ORF type:complete len:517 (-),score=69.61 gnl/TRDRNA2_/TRDRNA2_128405_c0_seq1:193-1590(-)
MSWVRGGATVHREGPTAAPWDCQVDVLLEWQGQEPLDKKQLNNALFDVMQQHPLLRAQPPPDDSLDTLLGNGCCDFSSTAAATWALLNAVWSEHRSWEWRWCKFVRWVVTQALWWCWPRTLVLEHDCCRHVDIHTLSRDSDGWSKNQADEVYDAVGQAWTSWYDSRSMVNVCLIMLNTGSETKQYLYCTLSHKYCDGGCAATFVHALRESYEARMRAEESPGIQSAILQVQQDRLWSYLSGRRCPQGSVDAYFMDINNDSFYHDIGHTVGAYFTERVCNTMRAVGLRIGCSEEIAWLACITCALFRLMPDEKIIKIMMVHNGRLGDAENAIGCVSQYVMFSILCTNERKNTPLADVACRVKYAVTNGKFTRPGPCEQAHAKVNIGGMIGADGHFSQVFRTHRAKKPGTSRAPHVLQLRMDNEGTTWSVKDFKCHKLWEPKVFWETTICAGLEIADGWFVNPLSWN